MVKGPHLNHFFELIRGFTDQRVFGGCELIKVLEIEFGLPLRL